MPLYVCRFCNKTFNVTSEYYSHLYNYKQKINGEEFQLAEFYHTRRENIKKKSYYNIKKRLAEGTANYRNNCNLCDYKSYYSGPFKSHLVGKHTIDELLEAGYEKKYIDDLVDKQNKRKIYQQNYNKKIYAQTHQTKPIALPKPEMPPMPTPIKTSVPPLIQVFNFVPFLIPIQYIN